MAARPVYQDVDIFITRRVRGREMRLRPCRKTNKLIGYIVAVIAKKRGISIHAICVMSDHYHIVIHDWFGNVVDFTRDCHSFIARVINHTFGDEESLWSSSQTSQKRPVTPEDTLTRIAYTMANPVKHQMVKWMRSWPGLRRAWPAPPKTFKRPKNFFRAIEDDGTWPDTATLEMSRPLGFEELADNELAIKVHKRIAEVEKEFQDKNEDEGRGYVGRRQVLRVSRYKKATSPEKKRRRHENVVCADPDLYKEAVKKERTWRAVYADRLTRWCAGDRDVVFPHGTYKMRVLHNANVAPPPP